MRLLAFSDVQMDAHPKYSGPDGRLVDTEAVLGRILSLARDEEVDAIVFAGDAFQHRAPSPDAILAWERPLVEHRSRSRIPIFAIPGNHDIRNNALGCALEAFDLAQLLTLHRTPNVQLGEVAICFLPWTPTHYLIAGDNGATPRDDLSAVAAAHLHTIAADLAGRVRECKPILVTHFAIDGDQDGFSKLVREPVLDPDRLAEDFSCVVAGHFERPQLIIEEPPVLYCGSPYPVDFGQDSYEHGCWVIETDGADGTYAEFMPIAYRPLVTLDIEKTGVDPVAHFALNDSIGWDVPEGAIVRLKYTATEEEARRIDKTKLRGSLLAAGAVHVEIRDEIVRATRARVQIEQDSLGELDALRLYLEANSVNGDRGAAMLARTQRYLETSA